MVSDSVCVHARVCYNYDNNMIPESTTLSDIMLGTCSQNEVHIKD